MSLTRRANEGQSKSNDLLWVIHISISSIQDSIMDLSLSQFMFTSILLFISWFQPNKQLSLILMRLNWLPQPIFKIIYPSSTTNTCTIVTWTTLKLFQTLSSEPHHHSSLMNIKNIVPITKPILILAHLINGKHETTKHHPRKPKIRPGFHLQKKTFY